MKIIKNRRSALEPHRHNLKTTDTAHRSWTSPGSVDNRPATNFPTLLFFVSTHHRSPSVSFSISVSSWPAGEHCSIVSRGKREFSKRGKNGESKLGREATFLIGDRSFVSACIEASGNSRTPTQAFTLEHPAFIWRNLQDVSCTPRSLMHYSFVSVRNAKLQTIRKLFI